MNHKDRNDNTDQMADLQIERQEILSRIQDAENANKENMAKIAEYTELQKVRSRIVEILKNDYPDIYQAILEKL